MKRQAATTIKGKMEKRRMEVTATFNEIVDTIEKYFTIAPFEWFKDVDAEVGSKSFPEVPDGRYGIFTSFTEHWIGKLLHEAADVKRRLDELKEKADEPGELAFATHEFGFICGVLVGSRYMGATRKQLLEQCHAWTMPRLKWEEGRLAVDVPQ